MLLGSYSKAQTYSGIGITPNGYDYDTITVDSGDSLKFTFSGLNAGAFGQAKLRVSYAGDFGDGSEFLTVILPNGSALSGVGPSQFGDCTSDIDSVYFNATLINSWSSSDTFTLVTSNQVNTFCTEQRVRVELVYDYCIFGIPTYASFIIPDDITCNTSGTQALVGTPAGGTYVGTGMSGNNFNPSGLTPGNYTITYTATDGIGCTTSLTQSIKIASSPAPINTLLCENETPAIDFGGSKYVSSNDLTFTSIIDTSAVLNFPAVTVSPTTYFYANYIQPAYYILDTVVAQDSLVVDHDFLTGDDRGGIVISDTNVYIVGDNNTARYNLDLLNGVSLPVNNDALFNNLTTKKIYSFTNSANDVPNNGNSPFVANAIVELDIDLNFTSTIIPLSQSITIDYPSMNSGLMLSGYSEMVICDENNEYLKVEIVSGVVTSLGMHPSITPYGSENWLSWGVLGFDGADYHAFYRNGNTSTIGDYNFTTQVETNVTQITDWSDMASFTVDSETNRLYFHYEGSTGTFGGSSETLGYTTLEDSLNFLPGTTSCPAPITFTFNSVNLGPDEIVCESEGVFVVEGGFGFDSYTWNGDNNNWNVFPVTDSGQVILVAIDSINCSLTDTILVDFDTCLGVNENLDAEISIFPIPTKESFTINSGLNAMNEIIILDLNGKVVLELNNLNSSSVNVKHNLTNGVYLVKIQSGELSTLRKIIVN